MVEEYLPVEKLGRDLVMPQQWRAIPNGEVVNEPNGQSKKFNYVHMGMIAELPDERLVKLTNNPPSAVRTAAEGKFHAPKSTQLDGPRCQQVLAFQASAVLEAAEDQRIWYTVSQDKSGRTWGKLMPLHPETRRAAQWAPVLHWSEAGGGSLIMFHAESDPHCLREGGKNGKQPRYKSSATFGPTPAAESHVMQLLMGSCHIVSLSSITGLALHAAEPLTSRTSTPPSLQKPAAAGVTLWVATS